MKNEKLISVRLPKALVNELKLVLHKDHYMTLSEAIRSIVREQYLKGLVTKPVEKMNEKELIQEIKKLRELVDTKK